MSDIELDQLRDTCEKIFKVLVESHSRDYLVNICRHEIASNVWFVDIQDAKVYTLQCDICKALLKSRARKWNQRSHQPTEKF